MSMTREEIVERLEDAHMNDNMGAVVAVIQQLNADIAERALPVTREWLESVKTGLFKRKTPLGSVYFSSSLVAYHPAKDQWFMNGGSVDLKITTRGQLLDLLSGLGGPE